jgi:serine/threonine protein kinase
MAGDEDTLADLLIQWEEILDSGREVSAQELCHDCPQLIEELSRRIKAMKHTAWMNKPLDSGDDPSGDDPLSPAPDDPPRTLAARYRLDARIGEGGFAQVWRGYDLELLRTIAVKMPKASYIGAVDSLLAEARRVARLKHPGIVPVHDVGRDGDSCFIVSEFVEGGTLADHLTRSVSEGVKKGASEGVTHESLADAAGYIRWMAEICEALDYAHSHGIVHRDIKPANILIDHNGRALLADFGIALSSNKTGQFAPSLGTLAYMSPEQLEGKPVDARSDIYSVGVLLCQLLTGKLPYDARDQNSLRNEIVAGAIHLTAPILRPELRSICQRCLAHDPRERYSSAKELAADLKSLVTNTMPTPSRPAKRWGGMIAISVVAAVAVIVVMSRPPVTPDAGAGSSMPTIPNESSESSMAADREAAAWALSLTADLVTVRIQTLVNDEAGKTLTVKVGDPLPTARFRVLSLEIFGSEKVWDADVVRHLPSLHKIEMLRFERCRNITDACLETLKGLPNLKYLILADTSFSGVACAELAKSLPLHALTISANQLTPELIDVMRASPNLINFGLHHGSDSHLQQILRVPHLQMLHFIDESAAELATWQQLPEALPKLRILELSNTPLTDAFLPFIARCPKLEDLSLPSTSITDQGLLELQSCRSLRRLNLRNTSVTPKGVATFRVALPNCQVTWETTQVVEDVPSIPDDHVPLTTETITFNDPSALDGLRQIAHKSRKNRITPAVIRDGDLVVSQTEFVLLNRTYSTLKEVDIEGRILPEHQNNFRFLIGPIHGILNWEIRPENHFRHIPKFTKQNHNYWWTRPSALSPGIYRHIIVRQDEQDIVVLVDTKEHFRRPGKLHGTIAFGSSNDLRDTIGIRTITITGKRAETVPIFPSHLSHEAAKDFGSWSGHDSLENRPLEAELTGNQ